MDFCHLWAVVLPKFSLSRLHSSKETFNTNFLASRYFKMKNTSLPVDVRRSKTTLPKLPNDRDARRALRDNKLQILVSLKVLRTESQYVCPGRLSLWVVRTEIPKLQHQTAVLLCWSLSMISFRNWGPFLESPDN